MYYTIESTLSHNLLCLETAFRYPKFHGMFSIKEFQFTEIPRFVAYTETFCTRTFTKRDKAPQKPFYQDSLPEHCYAIMKDNHCY